MSDIRFNQWLHQSGTGGVSQVASGAVGVGTTNPLADFYVRGDAQITGILTAGHIAMGSSITFGDNDRIYLGDGTDFQLYHASSDNNSYIVESGAGSLVVNASKFHVKNAANNEDVAVFNQSGNNELYFSNSKKFETTNTGAVVTGILTATSFSGGLPIPNEGNDRIITSSGSGAVNAEANLQFDGTNLFMPNELRHLGDPDTKIGFDTDTIKFETAGSERLRINSTGDVGIGTQIPVTWSGGRNLSLVATNGGQIELKKLSNDIRHYIWGTDDLNIGGGYTNGSSSNLRFLVNGNNERMRITSTGQILVGTTSDGGTYDGVTPAFVSEANSAYHAYSLVVNSTNSGHSGILQFVRSRGTSDGANTIVQDGDRVGSIYGIGADGTNRDSAAAAIDFRVDGTPGANDMPGRIEFRTTADGASVPTERLRITSSGQINATGNNTGNPIGITIKNSNTAAYSHARLRLESQNASKYADVWCDVPNNSLRLAYNGSNSLYLSQDGNVGLGTATPQHSGGYATLTVSGSTGGQIAFFGGPSKHFIWANSSGNLNIGGGYVGGGDVKIFANGNNERLRVQGDGHVSLRNSTNSHQEIQWYSGTSKSATIGWGNGSANWEFKHFRADSQADNPYANIDFFTGSTTSPTRALRITEDGNHIREKHSRFATRVDYSGGNESPNSKIPMNAGHVNVGNDFSSSNARFTAPVDGDYAFWFHTNVARSGSGSYYATWYKNGSEVNSTAGGRIYDQHSGGGWNNLSGCIMLALQEGDYVEVYNGGTAVNYDGDNYGQWMGWLVG